jgi:hypothetical protein
MMVQMDHSLNATSHPWTFGRLQGPRTMLSHHGQLWSAGALVAAEAVEVEVGAINPPILEFVHPHN